jgi:hypothetical protein
VLNLAAKAAISGIVIAVASEIARRSPALGALIVSLPLVSLLALIWLWHDTGDSQRCRSAGAVYLLVRAADSADVFGCASAAAQRHGFLARNGSRLRANHLALFCDGLGAGEIRRRVLTRRLRQPCCFTAARRWR